MENLKELGQIHWQLQEPTRNEKIAVGTTTQVIFEKRAETQERKVLIIRNTSDAVNKIITIHFGQGSAVGSEGIILNQNESITDSSESGYSAFQGTITAICSAAGGQLSIFER